MNSENHLSKKLKPLLEKSSIHGLSNIFISKRPFNRLLWLMFFIIFVLLAILFVKTAFTEYYKYEVNTELKIRQKNEIEFPTITVCNLELCGFINYDFAAYLKKHKQDEETRSGINIDNIIEDEYKRQNIKTNLFSAKEIFLRKYDPSNLEKVLSDTTDFFNNMLVNCIFNQQNCTYEDFEFYRMGEFSKCYKFNSGLNIHKQNVSIRKVSRFGKQNGLRIELNLGKNHECKSPLTSTSGLAIYIHEPSYSLNEDDDAILARPNTQTEIVLELTNVEKLPHPYSDCFKDLKSVRVEDSSLISETIQLIKSYTQQYCLQLCFQKFLIQNCNCFESSLTGFNPKNVNKCTKFIDSLYTCQYLVSKLFYNGINDKKCVEKCPKGFGLLIFYKK